MKIGPSIWSTGRGVEGKRGSADWLGTAEDGAAEVRGGGALEGQRAEATYPCSSDQLVTSSDGSPEAVQVAR